MSDDLLGSDDERESGDLPAKHEEKGEYILCLPDDAAGAISALVTRRNANDDAAQSDRDCKSGQDDRQARNAVSDEGFDVHQSTFPLLEAIRSSWRPRRSANLASFSRIHAARDIVRGVVTWIRLEH